MDFQLGPVALALLPEHAVFEPTQRTLFVSDCHWGKDAAFRVHGSPIPRGVMKEDLGRLSRLIDRTDARRLVVLGDLLHDRSGVTPSLVEEVAAWRASLSSTAFTVVPGNHDQGLLLELVEPWRMDVWPDETSDGGLLLGHEPGPRSCDGAPRLCGHLHPVFEAHGGGDRVRLPCFWVRRSEMVLPAFGRFTGGAIVRPRADDRVIVCTGDGLFE